MNTIGNNIKITFFGESHSKYIGATIDNLPAGLKIDFELIDEMLRKRRPKPNINTARIEPDNYQFISGVLNGVTTGAALTFLIENKNTNSKDYEKTKDIPRPSHADFPAYIKYNGKNDYRGGGIFSGRLTAIWMIIGSISKQLLEKKKIVVASHIASINTVKDDLFSSKNLIKETIELLNNDDFPVINQAKKADFMDVIKTAKNNLDSVGGVIESAIFNVPIGLGEPIFLSVESYISQLIFSIPAVKAMEFGEGFKLTEMFGSEANDQYHIKDKKIAFISNNNGGILGGLTTGEPLVMRVAIKPTPSIAKPQKSVDMIRKENVELEITGRHDPQIVSRVIHVINMVLYFAILDLLLFQIDKGELL